jgi:hypothetical protein
MGAEPNAGPWAHACPDARNPEGVLAETSTLSGFSIPVVVRPGTGLRSGFAVGLNQRLCDPKIALPVSEEFAGLSAC